jgi:hypothetical protein
VMLMPSAYEQGFARALPERLLACPRGLEHSLATCGSDHSVDFPIIGRDQWERVVREAREVVA